jgi:hypothetical protein
MTAICDRMRDVLRAQRQGRDEWRAVNLVPPFRFFLGDIPRVTNEVPVRLGTEFFRVPLGWSAHDDQ